MNGGAWKGFSFSFSLIFVASSLWGAPPEKVTDEAADSALESVREALQREVYGMNADREDLLAKAFSTAPEFGPARWNQGFVKLGSGDWLKVGAKPDQRRQMMLKEYEKRRASAGDSIAGQMQLADWCNKHQMTEQERVHLARICDLSPHHPVAQARLGHMRMGSEWVSIADRRNLQQRDAAAKTAAAKWTPIIAKLGELLSSSDQSKRMYAVEHLKQIEDWQALRTLQAIVGQQGESQEMLVLEITAKINRPEAVVEITRHAVFSPSLRVRQAAVEKLKACRRDHYAPMLISSMYTPVVSRVALTALPNGRLAYRHEFLREGAENQELLVLETQYQRIARLGGDREETASRAIADAQVQAAALETAAQRQRALTTALNDRIGWVLSETMGVKLPALPDEWWAWWSNENEVFVAGSKYVNTIAHTREVQLVDASTGLTSNLGPGVIPDGQVRGPRHEWLVAGTLVWTEQGTLAIEKVLPGDCVLARDVDTGELTYKPVLRATVRPKAQLLRLDVGNESFETSAGHLFWVSGEGWLKARDLRSGMLLHTADGPIHVKQLREGTVDVTYNLVVADFNTYFVGKQKILSHDNTIRRVTDAIVPGLQPE
ncbi:hypothetical protein ETAA8_50030 [Anatilimnocola aggregata]|uniref:Hint domain-containing protein n=1 Tax=Anatilimnocola aggregata TaxID=2528021 RepID=A0A517YI25_9BACT|nr:polymorphic toxin-type HINT domain-containing protein [Anatilimnocola aggregata]QDU29887.1 hypothetical protein ETAA8_50030 [Anatilimnocola aggregata]